MRVTLRQMPLISCQLLIWGSDETGSNAQGRESVKLPSAISLLGAVSCRLVKINVSVQQDHSGDRSREV